MTPATIFLIKDGKTVKYRTIFSGIASEHGDLLDRVQDIKTCEVKDLLKIFDDAEKWNKLLMALPDKPHIVLARMYDAENTIKDVKEWFTVHEFFSVSSKHLYALGKILGDKE